MVFVESNTFYQHQDLVIAEYFYLLKCYFLSCFGIGYGGGIKITGGGYNVDVVGCVFKKCEVSGYGGGGGVYTDVSNTLIDKSEFVECACCDHGLGSCQEGSVQNNLTNTVYLLCHNGATGGLGAWSQMSGYGRSKNVNGSHLSTVVRESAYHHRYGPRFLVQFQIYASCTGPYTLSCFTSSSETTLSEYVCVTNSTSSVAIMDVFNGHHSAKHFILLENQAIAKRYPGYYGSVTFENGYFVGTNDQSYVSIVNSLQSIDPMANTFVYKCLFACTTKFTILDEVDVKTFSFLNLLLWLLQI